MGPHAPSRNNSAESETTLEDTTTAGSAADDDVVKTAIEDFGIARLGNGQDQEISVEQWHLIQELYGRVTTLHRQESSECDSDFCNHETCRRYLVARQWNIEKAERQLIATLKWREETDPGGREFCQSPKCLDNPLALSMRIVGWDDLHGRPIGYTCFRQAHDRYDADANLDHVLLLLEAMSNLIAKRCRQQRQQQQGLNTTAENQQCIWVVDFDGFGLWDQNPRSSVLVARLLQHYPEMLNSIILMNAPMLFNGLWRMVAPMLDERVRSKVVFCNGNAETIQQMLQERVGDQAAEWIWKETLDNQKSIVDIKKGKLKKYWIPPSDESQHDARGIASYVHSDFYIKTPGDFYEERTKEGST